MHTCFEEMRKGVGLHQITYNKLFMDVAVQCSVDHVCFYPLNFSNRNDASVQNTVVDAKQQVMSGTMYYLTIEIHTTDCLEGSPSAEDEAACQSTSTQVHHIIYQTHQVYRTADT